MRMKVQSDIKKQIKEGVPESELHVISFSKGYSPDWVKPDKEFRLNGRMYDVVRTEEDLSKTTYYCVDDQQETKLFTSLDQLIRGQLLNQQSPVGKTHHTALTILTLKYYWNPTDISIYSGIVSVTYAEVEEKLCEGFTSLLTPPPLVV